MTIMFVPRLLICWLDARARAVADRDHHDHRAHADDDAEHRQRRAHLVLADGLRGQLDQASCVFMRPPSPSSCVEVVRGGAAVLHRLVAPDAAVAHFDDALRVDGDVRLVRDEDDRDALLVQLLEERHHFDRRARVEVAGRLVGQDQRRLGHERAGDGHALLLAAGELARLVVETLAESDALQRRGGERARVALAAAAVVEQRQLDVLERAGARQEIEALEDEAELLVADGGERVLVEAVDAHAVEQVRAVGRRVEAAEDVHQRRLAGAGRAHDGDELARRDGRGRCRAARALRSCRSRTSSPAARSE